MVVTKDTTVVLRDTEEGLLLLRGFNTVSDLSFAVIQEHKRNSWTLGSIDMIYSGHIQNITAQQIEDFGGLEHLQNVLDELDSPPYVLILRNPK